MRRDFEGKKLGGKKSKERALTRKEQGRLSFFCLRLQSVSLYL
jgi:hypothetical protein